MSDQLTTPDVRPPDVVSNRDTTRAHATRLLEALGDNPATIAANLAAQGIRGERCNEGTCPIATYLMRSDLGLHSVSVSGNVAVLFLGDHGQVWCYVDVPDAVEEFIERFDFGAYDELLVAGGAR
jgi:hypothetical protein